MEALQASLRPHGSGVEKRSDVAHELLLVHTGAAVRIRQVELLPEVHVCADLVESEMLRDVLERVDELIDTEPFLQPMLGLTQLSNYLTLKGSFPAVSKPIFASEYALESSRGALQNALLCTVFEAQFFV